MIVKKSYHYRIYPTKTQEELLGKHFGATRFVWNYFLNNCKQEYIETKKSSGYYKNCNLLTELKKDKDYSWLREINSQSLQGSLRDLEVSYARFFF